MNAVNLKEALGVAMQASLKDCELIDFTVFGPRRSGTNYLQKIILLNTLNMRFLCLDKNFNDQVCKLVVEAFERLGSKHSMNDRSVDTKLNENHMNFVIVRDNLKDWIYSRHAYQKSFQPDFDINNEIIRRWIDTEYLEFLELIAKNCKDRLIFLKHEDTSAQSLRSKISASYQNIILTNYPVEMTTRMGPSGSISGNKYVKKASEGQPIIDEYCASTIFIQQQDAKNSLMKKLDP